MRGMFSALGKALPRNESTVPIKLHVSFVHVLHLYSAPCVASSSKAWPLRTTPQLYLTITTSPSYLPVSTTTPLQYHPTNHFDFVFYSEFNSDWFTRPKWNGGLDRWSATNKKRLSWTSTTLPEPPTPLLHSHILNINGTNPALPFFCKPYPSARYIEPIYSHPYFLYSLLALSAPHNSPSQLS